MPPVCIQAHAELEVPAIINRGIDVVAFQNLVAVVPQFVVSRPVGLPAGLDLDLVPDAGGHGGQVGEGGDVLVAYGSVLDPRVELIAEDPYHA